MESGLQWLLLVLGEEVEVRGDDEEVVVVRRRLMLCSDAHSSDVEIIVHGEAELTD